jgi:hypothetical protein
MQKDYALVLESMDIPNDPSLALLESLHKILVDRPLLMEMLKSNLPRGLNLQVLL